MKDHAAWQRGDDHAIVNDDPEKAALLQDHSQPQEQQKPLSRKLSRTLVQLTFLALCLRLLFFGPLPFAGPKAGKDGHRIVPHRGSGGGGHSPNHKGNFPDPSDPFHFIPCTADTLPPALDDAHPLESYTKLYDPNPAHWSWGEKPASSKKGKHDDNEYEGRGVYLCGYLDVPLDYTNTSDKRIARLAVTKYHVSGIEFSKHSNSRASARAGKKSERTIVVDPGGPGGSGTSMAWRSGEKFSYKYANGTMDVLGWDPRGTFTFPAFSELIKLTQRS